MKKAGSVTDTDRIGAELAALTYDGVIGKTCFGKSLRTASLDGGMLVVRDGKLDSRVIPSPCK